MDIVIVGLNHKKTPIYIREKVSFTERKKEEAVDTLKRNHFIKENIILSTCNRSEIIAVVTDIDKGIEELKRFYINFFGLESKTMDNYFVTKASDKAVKHVFNVAAGLDSLVVGEDQILGQLRDSHEYAMDKDATGSILNTLIREAITTSKKIKRETKISEQSLSISTIAVKFIESIFETLEDKRVLVIGVGKMSRIAIENLIYRGVKEIYVTNRTKGHAIDLSKRYKEIGVIDFQDRYKMISQVDIVITSTSAPHYVLYKDEFVSSYNSENKLCIVDIALPRDVDPNIKGLDNVSLYELDQLKNVADENYKNRMEAAKIASQIIIEDCIKFENWYNCLPIYPIIKGLKNYTSNIIEKELNNFLDRNNHLNENDKKQVELFTKSLIKKVFKRPMIELKRAGEDKQGEVFAKVTKELFGLSEKGCKNNNEKN